MHVAVILTGALRTIKKTIKYLKKNVVLTPKTHVFACIQNDSSLKEEEWNAWFKEQLGDKLGFLEWFSLEKHPEFVTHRETQLQHQLLSDGWKNYLRTSGSMIEYFQLQLAYMKMSYHEQVHGFKYEQIVRARTDSIYAKRVDFHWLHWNEDEVATRLNKIKTELEYCKIDTTAENMLRYFMCTILSDDVIPNIQHIWADYAPCATERILECDLTATRLHTYIKEGRYMLTLRKNNLYIVRRELFYMIPTLGTFYGFSRAPTTDDYWFNAECQFRSACYYSCITMFDYGSLYEDRSVAAVHAWNEADFFDQDGNMLNSRALYCVVRK
jgi:hypothetical protein